MLVSRGDSKKALVGGNRNGSTISLKSAWHDCFRPEHGAVPEAAAQSPKKGGTLQFAISAETPHYDPHGSDTYATLDFAAPFYSTLLRFNLDKYPEVMGDLADSWTIAPDLMSYTFKLHPNVKFHSGRT